jgi:hypothetical protein
MPCNTSQLAARPTYLQLHVELAPVALVLVVVAPRLELLVVGVLLALVATMLLVQGVLIPIPMPIREQALGLGLALGLVLLKRNKYVRSGYVRGFVK